MLPLPHRHAHREGSHGRTVGKNYVVELLRTCFCSVTKAINKLDIAEGTSGCVTHSCHVCFFFTGTIVWAHGCLSRCVLLVTVHHCVEVYKQVHVLETVCPIELKDTAHQVLAQGVTRDASFLAAGTSSCHLLSACPQEDCTFVHETTRQAKLL